MDASKLVADAKRTSMRSYRELARDASLATSTITRIESGATDPTISTLTNVLRSCGFELTAVRSTATRRPRLAELASAWRETDSGPEIIWNRWRAMLDRLALHSEFVPEAIYTPPPPAGHPVVDALLAGVAEKLADDARLLRPSWAEATPGLERPFAPPTRRPRHIPPQLAERGLMIDGASLFRERSTVGA